MPPGEAWLQQDDSTLVHPVRPHGMSISLYIQYLPKRSYREGYGFGNWFGQCRGKAVHHRSHQEWGFVESWAWIDNQYVPVMQGWNASSHSTFSTCFLSRLSQTVTCLLPVSCFRTYVFGGLLVSLATDFTTQRRDAVVWIWPRALAEADADLDRAILWSRRRCTSSKQHGV